LLKTFCLEGEFFFFFAKEKIDRQKFLADFLTKGSCDITGGDNISSNLVLGGEKIVD
jgi:hypothetical protein